MSGETSAAPVRVLVVDDSASVRAVLRRFFSWTDDLRVVGEAAEGTAAVQAAVRLAPDVILMDLLMPGMDGYQAIEEIMRRRPTPILVLSSKATRDQVQTAFEALRRGAVEVLPKPEDTESWRHLATTLPEVIRSVARRGLPAAAGAAVAEPLGTLETAAAETAELRWLAIGASTGGPSALCDLLAALPRRPPLTALVVQHISPGFELGLVDWLAASLPFDLRLARDGERPPPGAVRLAPPDRHLRLAAEGTLRLDHATPPRHGHRPSVDELFASCAEVAPRRTAAALLTGMGIDGVEGLGRLAAAGALTLAQDGASAVVDGMPGAARARGFARAALPPREIGRYLAGVLARSG